jgi:hypothetical protein
MDRLDPIPTTSVPPEETPGLLAVIQELNATPDLRSGLSRVAELLRDCVPYDNLSVLLLDDLGRELRYELSVGLPPEIAEHWRFGMGQGLVGTAAQTGRVVRVGDVREDRSRPAPFNGMIWTQTQEMESKQAKDDPTQDQWAQSLRVEIGQFQRRLSEIQDRIANPLYHLDQCPMPNNQRSPLQFFSYQRCAGTRSKLHL